MNDDTMPPPSVSSSEALSMDATCLPGQHLGVETAASSNPFDVPRVSGLVAAYGATARTAAVFPRPNAPGVVGSESPPQERYEVLRTLGVGGYGEVDLVRDHDIDRLVARKRIKPDMMYPEVVSRFAREVRVVGRLEHPSIIPVHDVGLDERGYYFLMKYVEGETLEDIINRLKAADPDADRTYTYEYRTQIFVQVLRAMQCAHDRGIIHRDIKPANVMVGRWGEVLVLDWGIAKMITTDEPEDNETDKREIPKDARGTVEGWLMGTPAFMSPEQARGDNSAVDARSDVYALCAMLYEFLTLDHYLTPKESTMELLRAIQTEEPLGAVAVHHRYGVPPELAFAMIKGLAKDPRRRYQSVPELLARMQSITEGQIPVQCPCTGLKRTGGIYGRLINRHPILAVIVAVAIAGFAFSGMANAMIHLASWWR